MSKYIPGHPRCNEDLVRDLMNYNPTGALCQAFIMDAIKQHADAVAKLDPATMEGNAFINPHAWVKCAQHISAEIEKFYASPCRSMEDDDEPDEDDVAEWVGQHYRLDFHSLSGSRKAEFTQRYIRALEGEED